MDKYTNALEVLQRLPFGSMIYDVISIDGIVWELSLFVKEDAAHLHLYGQNPKIEIVAGMIEENEVSPVIIILRINSNRELMFETWLNYYATLGERALNSLMFQNRIVINLVDGNGYITRSIAVNNNIKRWIHISLNRIKNRAPWTMSEFDIAKHNICTKYKDIDSLYNKLSQFV